MAALLWAQSFPDVAHSQTAECDYDGQNPSHESARKSFQVFDFQCAEQEIQDLLKEDALSLEEKASAHMLLAAVYFEMLQDGAQRRGKTLEQFKEAFRAYRDWRGDLDIQSPEFRAIMEEAKQDIQAEENASAPKDAATEAPVVTRPPHAGSDSGKGGSTKWILIGLGVGAVGIAAIALGGGGGGNGNGDNTLPDFPAPPGGAK
jgi:Ca2+-binding EF-hand superfamily protein